MHSRSRPQTRCRPKGIKPLKMTIVTHFQLFLKRPKASKNARKWAPQWNLWPLKSQKSTTYRTPKKRPNHTTVKNGILCALEGGPRRHIFRQKHTSISEILKMSLQDPNMTAQASKLFPRLSKSLPIWRSKRLASLPRGLKEMARCRVMRAAHWILSCEQDCS